MQARTVTIGAVVVRRLASTPAVRPTCPICDGGTADCRDAGKSGASCFVSAAAVPSVPAESAGAGFPNPVKTNCTLTIYQRIIYHLSFLTSEANKWSTVNTKMVNPSMFPHYRQAFAYDKSRRFGEVCKKIVWPIPFGCVRRRTKVDVCFESLRNKGGSFFILIIPFFCSLFIFFDKPIEK